MIPDALDIQMGAQLSDLDYKAVREAIEAHGRAMHPMGPRIPHDLTAMQWTEWPDIESLTPREMDVLLLIGRGYSNKQIAKTLCIEERTARGHASSILQKLHLESRTQAAVRALKNNVFPDEGVWS